MNTRMTLAQRVLNRLEPDPARQAEWLADPELAPVLQGPAYDEFKDRIQQAQKIFIFGDYDADGILGTSILVKALRALGKDVGFYIPDRIKEGYGLNEAKVKLAHEKGYDTLITVDNGVKAHAALKLARELGLQVIVTDHHTLEEEVPADLLIHPDFMDETRQHICGAAVAYELARVLGVADDYLLSLAATATIADVMPVSGQNRAYIKAGILFKPQYDIHWNLLGLYRPADETMIGFSIIPKLNAPGRLPNLANANNVVRYFLDDQPQRLNHFAHQIQSVNESRKSMSQAMSKACLAKISPADALHLIVDEGLHEGILGLVAGRIMDETHKPVIVLTKSQQGCKASMRGPEGFDCLGYLQGFDHFQALGGHKQAAGFSLYEQDLQAFKDYVRLHPPVYNAAVPQEPLEIAMDDISLAAVEGLDALRPFGPGFQCPQFELKHPAIQRIYDNSGSRHRTYLLANGVSCVRFNQPAAEISRSLLDIESFVGELAVNEYNGARSPRFIIREIRYR